MSNTFEVLSKVDVSEFTEKKGKFSYLSWADAVDALLKHCPEATWEVSKDVNGYPYTTTPAGCFVEVSLTIDGITRTQVHPVLNNYNKTIAEPTAFDINTSIQRCLAKVIGLHGLGLYIYRGEDLPSDDKRIDNTVEPRLDYINKAYQVYKEEVENELYEETGDFKRMQQVNHYLTNDERIAVENLFGKETVPNSKKMLKTIVRELLSKTEADNG